RALREPGSPPSVGGGSGAIAGDAAKAGQKKIFADNAVVGAVDGGQLAQAWERLHGGDLTTLPARLRAAGFPPAVVRALVREEVDAQFGARRKALFAGQEEIPFWKFRSGGVDF